MDAGAASRLRTLLETKQRSPTSNQTAKRLARLVALSRLTKDVVGGSFTLNTRIAFGHGCDRPSYVRRHATEKAAADNLLLLLAIAQVTGGGVPRGDCPCPAS